MILSSLVDLTKREMWIVAIRENMDTRHSSAGAKFYRRMMPAQGAYQADSISERIRAGLNRAKAEGKKPGCPLALDQERILGMQRIYAGNPSIRRIAHTMSVSQGTVKKALESESGPERQVKPQLFHRRRLVPWADRLTHIYLSSESEIPGQSGCIRLFGQSRRVPSRMSTVISGSRGRLSSLPP